LNWVIEEERAFEFLDALQKQFNIYAELVLKSEQQYIYITNNNEDGLTKLLSEKQADIAELEKYNTLFAVEREALDKTPMGQFSCIDNEIDKVLEATETLLKKLVENENRDMLALQSIQEQHRQKIAQLEKGQYMAKAYLNRELKKNMDRSV
jgi:hypothetical protein